MKTILHLLKKDIRRYGWALLTLALVAAIQVYLYGTDAGLLESGANQALTMFTILVGTLLFFVLIVMVVQEETLADPDAYWLARPLARGKLLTEKILFLLILIGIGTLSEAVILVMNGGLSRIGYVAAGIVASLAVWNWQIFLAAQTRSLARYLLLVVAILVGFYTLMFAFAYMAGWSSMSFDIGMLPADLPEHIATAIQSIFWLFAGLGVLVHLYRTRRVRDCWLLLLPALFVAALLSPSQSFYGIGRSFSGMDMEEKLEIDQLRTKGTMLAMGDEFVEIEVVFKPADRFIKSDAWVTFNTVDIDSGGTKIELENSRANQRMLKEADGRLHVSLGQIKKGELEKIDGALDVRLGFQISFSEQVESGRLALLEGSSFVSNGNRLVVRNVFRHEERLTATIAGVVPQFGLERAYGSAWGEAFHGKFSFALARKDGSGTPLDFRISGSPSPFSRAQSAWLERTLADNENRENYEIVVYARKMTGHDYQIVSEESVDLVRP